MNRMSRRVMVVLALLLALALPAAVLARGVGESEAAQLAMEAGTVTVVHGVPGLTVDVYVNGALTLPDFAPGTVTDPLHLPAGTYEIVIVAAGGDPASPVLSGSAMLMDGDNVSIVAHLTADGAPALSLFANDLSPVMEGDGRLVVRHVAAAPAVDIALANKLGPVGTIEGLSNPNEVQLDIPGARPYEATIFPAGSDTAVFGPAKVNIKPARSTIVYAVGSLADGTFGLLVQKIGLETMQEETGTVTVVHGVPGLTVDVYVNGALTLPAFAPGTVTDPLTLPTGDYDIVIVPEGGDPASPAIAGSAFLPADANVSLVAHLLADGTPTLSVYVNDVSAITPGQSRLVVRHDAAAPAVDVALYLKNGDLVGTIEGLSNPDEVQLEVLRGPYQVTIAPAGGDPVFGPAPLKLLPNRSTIVYAVGSLADGSFQLLTQTIRLPLDR